MIAPSDLAATFGSIDIYLFDQLLRGRIPPGSKILDAGCGGGRNLRYLLAAGFDVSGADTDPVAINRAIRLAAELNPDVAWSNFRCEPLEALSFTDGSMDVVMCSAVLHFAASDQQFGAMLQSMWRVLRPGGLFFCRLASSIGMETRVISRGERRYLLPDGSERYLVDEALLLDWTRRLDGALLDPLKTTIVQDQRCMTTWVLRKGSV